MIAPVLSAMILALAADGWTLQAEPPAPVRIEHADDGVADLWMTCEGAGKIAVGALIPDLEAAPADGASIVKLSSDGMTSVSPATLAPNEAQGGWTVSSSVSAVSPVLDGVPDTGRLRIEVEEAEVNFRLRRDERPLFAEFLAACAAN